ncbi:MAG: SPFH/Band domain protein, partial [Marmoricola sp.]|nr:SPFH/Band domain protein [Marmoricola sp.]
AYQYLQMMPKIAEGSANKVWVVPSEITKALEGLGSAVHEVAGIPHKVDGPRKRVEVPTIEPRTESDASLSSAHAEVQKAIEAADVAARSAGTPPASTTGATPPADAPTTPVTDPGDPSGEAPTGQ